MSPARPVIHKLKDHLKVDFDRIRIFESSKTFLNMFQPEGNFARKTETSTMFVDLQPSRPVIHRLYDHGSQVIPEGKLESK